MSRYTELKEQLLGLAKDVDKVRKTHPELNDHVYFNVDMLEKTVYALASLLNQTLIELERRDNLPDMNRKLK